VVKPLAVTINGVTTNFTFDTSGRSALAMGWTPKVITFTAAGASSTINFVSDVSGAGGTLNAGAAIDNVQIVPLGAVTAIAVPVDRSAIGAALLLALAALVLLSRRRGALSR
jgi:hypothetical protein